MNPEHIEEDTRGAPTWKETLIADRWRLVGLGVIGFGVATFIGVDFGIPRWLRLFGLTAAVSALVGYGPAGRIVGWLHSTNYTYLLDLDARENEFAVWQLPPDVWSELTVSDGELYKVQATVPAWTGKGYDPETNSVEGTWRGSASDMELVEDRERIDEIRTVLEDLAKEGLTIRVKQSGIIRDAVRGIVMSFVEGFETESLYDGDEIEASVHKALSRWDSDGSDDDDLDQEDGDDDGDDDPEGTPSTEPDQAAVPVADGGSADE